MSLPRLMASCLALVASPAVLAATDAAAWMFDPSVVVDVDLVIPQSSMDQIPVDMGAERPYVPATFTMTYTSPGGAVKSYGPWAITLKVKGMYGSFRALPYGEKAGLKLKFPSGNRPDGLRKFTLNNMVQDGTMVHEVLAYDVFRSMGVAAPRAGYARVTINGVYFGIYLNLETPDSVMLPRWHESTGHLYEGSYGSWWGDVADPFGGHYEVDEGSSADRSDLQALISAAQSPAKGWMARMHPVADLEQMTRMWACEWFTGHWDGYSQFITNNYYLHADAAGRFTMMPWGADQTFTWAERFDASADHFIFNNCMRDPVGRAMYTDALQQVALKWVELDLPARAEAAYASVASESWGIGDVHAFVANRLAEHQAWAAQLPPPPLQVSVRTRNSRPGQVDIHWQAPRQRRQLVDGYVVEYRTAGAPWQRLDRRFKGNTAHIRGLAPGLCIVRVRATGKAGDSLPVAVEVTVR